MTNILLPPARTPSPLPPRAVRARRTVLGPPEFTREERAALLAAVRLAETLRLGLTRQAFDPAVSLPRAAGRLARRAERQLSRCPRGRLSRPALLLGVVSASVVLQHQSVPCPALRSARGKAIGRLRVERAAS